MVRRSEVLTATIFGIRWNLVLGLEFGSVRAIRTRRNAEETSMNGIIYIIGLIVVIMFILSFLGLR